MPLLEQAAGPDNSVPEQSFFEDGEQDFWPISKAMLQRYDNLSDAEYAEEVDRIERERGKFIDLLISYATSIGRTFALTLPERVNITHRSLNDIWAYSLEHVAIQIPRYVLEKRPKGTEFVLFRKEIPAVYIIVNMAHELSHLERHRAHPETYQKVNKVGLGERYKLDATAELREEEIATDMHAFALLLKLNIPITPALFVAQVPKNYKMPGYREELLTKLERYTQQ